MDKERFGYYARASMSSGARLEEIGFHVSNEQMGLTPLQFIEHNESALGRRIPFEQIEVAPEQVDVIFP